MIARLTIFLLLLSFVSTKSFSQNSNLGDWLIYLGNKQINSKWNWHNEVQYRNYNAIGDLEQLLLRTGIGYTFTKSTANILLGYGYILSENYITNNTKNSINEHRIYQQFITKQSLSKLNITHRYRFEERFVASEFKFRFRYFLSLTHPILSLKDEIQQLYLSAYNEIFLNSTSNVFDRNRLYGGIGFKFNKKIKVELAYMNQFFENSQRDQINIVTHYNF